MVDGTVNVTKTSDGSSISVTANYSTSVDNDSLSLDAITKSDWINSNEQRDAAWALSLRERIKTKYSTYVSIAKSQYNLTDAQVDQYLHDAIAGRYSQSDIKAALDKFGIDIKV